MFQYDIQDLRQVSTRKDKQAQTERWIEEKCPQPQDFRFTNGETTEYKGKRHTFVCVSYGDFMAADGHARRFICYRAPVVNHTLYFSWIWDDKVSKWFRCEDQKFVTF